MPNKKKQTNEPAFDNSVGKQPTNEEQMQRRQSFPRPTAEDELMRMQERQENAIAMGQEALMNGQGVDSTGALDGFRALDQPIGEEFVRKATLTLQRYKAGKANLERRIIENEQWYKLRHWECLRKKETNMVEPSSAWLFNCIANKLADAMDNFPAPNILPREEGDKAEAKMLTSILPVILESNDYEQTYESGTNYKLKNGTGVYGVFWDSSKLNGIGDISIKRADILNLFWTPGITDIQQSKHLFHVELVDNDTLIEQYPQLQNKLSSPTIDVAKYIYDDSVDTSDYSCVVDMYYKKRNADGKQILHYVKFVNNVVLFATENETQPKVNPMTGEVIAPPMADTGLYDHGEYPFVFDTLFEVEGTPAGFGYIDVGKSAQEYIDRGNQAIMQNLLVNARPRHFIRSDGAVNEKEYADITNDFVHVDGNLGQDSILPINSSGLSGVYVSVIANKIDELKETTGNRDVSNGGSTGGITAASAIAAMQESSSKLSRRDSKSSYRAFRKVCLLVIELIRQFYDMPRCFRILGERGAQEFVYYSNAGIVPQMQGTPFGMDMGMRIPLFDVEVSAQKQSPYSKMSQNELALQFYGAGFFNPQMADQALACLEMMDFDHKDPIMQRIAQNGGMMQQMMMLAQVASAATGDPSYMQGVAAQFGMALPGMGADESPAANVDKTEALGGSDKNESTNTKKARMEAAERTAPR